MKIVQRSVITGLYLCLCATVVAEDSQEPTIVATAGRLAAVQADGTTVWQVTFADPAVPSWERLDNGLIVLGSGYVIDGNRGLIVARGPKPSGDNGGGGGHLLRGDTCPYWSEAADIYPLGSNHYVHDILFDSQGDAWVINGPPLQARRSNGHDGTWQEPVLLGGSCHSVEAVIDSNDNITVVAIDGNAWRYEPGVGWSGPEAVGFGYYIEAAVDCHGNVVVVWGDGTMFGKTYDAASGVWSEVVQVSPSTIDYMLLPTLLANRDGTAISLVYMAGNAYGDPSVMYSQRFDLQTQSWAPVEILPNSLGVTYGCYDTGSRWPGAVDHLGNVTVFWGSQCGVLQASRMENGVWQSPHGLYGADQGSIQVFASADVNDAGDVLLANQNAPNEIVDGELVGHIAYPHILYRAGVGWDDVYDAYYYTEKDRMFYKTRSRVSFYRGANAIATFYGMQDDVIQLTSLPFNGTDWEDLIDIPGTNFTFFQESAANQGEPLLVYSPSDDLTPGQATWLRNIAGDLDGDCDVDLEDLATLLASYGVDAGGDIDGDGDTDLTDLAALLGNYGEEIP